MAPPLDEDQHYCFLRLNLVYHRFLSKLAIGVQFHTTLLFVGNRLVQMWRVLYLEEVRTRLLSSFDLDLNCDWSTEFSDLLFLKVVSLHLLHPPTYLFFHHRLISLPHNSPPCAWLFFGNCTSNRNCHDG